MGNLSQNEYGMRDLTLQYITLALAKMLTKHPIDRGYMIIMHGRRNLSGFIP